MEEEYELRHGRYEQPCPDQVAEPGIRLGRAERRKQERAERRREKQIAQGRVARAKRQAFEAGMRSRGGYA